MVPSKGRLVDLRESEASSLIRVFDVTEVIVEAGSRSAVS